MKLRAFTIHGYRNLSDLTLTFPEPARSYPPIYLLIGENGTGKTGLLRALTFIITALERRQAPHLNFELTYQLQLGSKPLDVHIMGDGSGAIGGVTFDVTDETNLPRPLEPGAWRDYLPEQVVVYTSGNLGEWETLIGEAEAHAVQPENDLAERLRTAQAGNVTDEILGYEAIREATQPSSDRGEEIRSRVLFFSHEHLRLALLATLALEDAAKAEVRAEIFRKAGLERLEAFAVELRPRYTSVLDLQIQRRLWEQTIRDYDTTDDDNEKVWERHLQALTEERIAYLPEGIADRVRRFAELAKPRLRNADGSYHLLFPMTPETRQKLVEDLGFTSPLQFYREFLVDLHERGVLSRVDLIIRKADLPDSILDRHLSDGEFEFLGRVALFLLLDQPGSLFLLDEPETHFNDVWKRELVDILARTLGDQLSTVLLTTHSSIAISDVPTPQVILLSKDESGKTQVIDAHAPMFGADPSDIMINLFGTRRAGGEYSTKSLRDALERGDPNELTELLEIVGPGYWRFRIRDRLEALNASSD